MERVSTASHPPVGPLARLRTARSRNESLLLLALLVAPLAFGLGGKSVTLGIYGLGVVSGAALAMHALGVVLVYRSNRIIDFAQFSFGAAAAGVFSVLVNGQPLLRMTRAVCPPCLGETTPTQAHVNYVISALLSLGLSIGLAWFVYRVVVRRFENAPRLVLTVATIFLAQALPIITALVGKYGLTEQQAQDSGALGGAVKPPVDVTLTVSQGGTPVLFHLPELLTLVVGLAAAVAVITWMRRSSTGTAIRAASEDAGRAATLGIDVAGVTSKVWLIVGLLSGLAGMLSVSQGAVPAGFDASTLTQILLVGVLARLFSLTIAAVGAVVVGVVQEAALWSFGSTTAFEGGLVFLVAVALLLQRKEFSRADLDTAGAWAADREIRATPPELASLSSVRSWRRSVLATVVVLVVGYPFVVSPGNVQVGSLVLAYALVALSLLVLTGWTGQISLGQLAFGAVGAYVAAVCHAPFLLALPLGGVAGAMAAVLVGIPALRLQGLHLAVISMAFAVSVSAVLLNPDALGTFLPDALPNASLLVTDATGIGYYFVVVALLVVAALLVSGLRSTRTGRALIAARDNEQAAQAYGINLLRLRLSGFAVSGALSGVAGVVIAFQSNAVLRPDFAPDLSLLVFLLLVIGGTGAISGPMVGCAYGLLAFIGSTSPILNMLLTGVGGLALLLFFPGGLVRVLYGLRDAFLRRVASRNRIVVPSLLEDRDLDRGFDVAGLAPKVSRSGSTAFVPTRYALSHQWVVNIPHTLLKAGETPRPRKERRAAADSFAGIEPTGDSA